jgi:hypothetical protein
MGEMTALLAAIYRTYTTNVQDKQIDVSPGITSRFEVFGDETSGKIKVGTKTLRDTLCYSLFRAGA